MTRIAHITDIHIMVPPRITQLTPKRLLGCVNLYALGRKGHFSRRVQEALPIAVAATQPDVLLCTGDLTAQATPEEFEAFASLFSRLLEAQPSVMLSGNHDVYTQDADRSRRIEDLFSEFTGTGPWPRLHLPTEDLACITVDTCRAHPLSVGLVTGDQIERLDTLLGSDALAGRNVLLMLHYPLRNRRGAPYGPPTRALKNARALEQVLGRHADTITAILHGHEHHGFQTRLPEELGGIPILNPGASGYAPLPRKDRTAHFNVYSLDETGLQVERFRFSDESGTFEPEPGGAYATGR
jgi:3',5'-cyclic AMP phosphodiesterase CpdA